MAPPRGVTPRFCPPKAWALADALLGPSTRPMAAFRLRARRSACRWWLKVTRRHWRAVAPRRRRRPSNLNLHTKRSLADRELTPIDGSPPQQQRTRSKLEHADLGTLPRKLFESPEPQALSKPILKRDAAHHADNELSKQLRVGKLHARIAALEIRVHKLENAKMTLRSTEADLLRRLAWYCPEKWAHLAARTARALPPEWRWPRDRGAVAGLAIHTCAVAVQTGT